MEKYIEIGGRLHSTATGNVTTGANEILDDELNKKQSQINSETLQHVESIDAALQELSPDQTQALALATDVNTLKAKSVRSDETQSLTDAEKEQAISNMGVTGVYDISGEHPVSDHPKKYSTLPAALADVPVGRRKSGMSVKALMQLTQEMYHVEVTEGVTDLPTGYNEYELSEASSMTTGDYTYSELDTENFSAIPSTVGASVLYYIYDSQSSSYTTWLLTKSSDSTYAYKQYLYMQEYANTTADNTAFLTAVNWQGVDDEPTAGSENLVKSGGVGKELALGAIYDVSAHNNGAIFESLSALLSDANLNALIPTAVRKGGMSVKFVQSSDNKYVQYRLTANEWSTNTDDWAIADEGVYVENPEFIYVKTDKDNKILWAIKTDGSIYYGAGVPQQVIDYINEKIAELSLDEYEDIVAFLNNLEKDDKTLQDLLDEKVDKEGGKSLIDADYASSQSVINNSEYLQITTDSENKILEGITARGTKEVNIPTIVKEDTTVQGDLHIDGNIFNDKLQNRFESIENVTSHFDHIHNSEYIEAKTDSEHKILEGYTKEGVKKINTPVELPTTEISHIYNNKWLDVKTDESGKILEGITKGGEKHISQFDEETNELIKDIANGTGGTINIPLLDENFESPVKVTITGTKGDKDAKYEFELPLKDCFNIRFKFRIADNLMNQNSSVLVSNDYVIGQIDNAIVSARTFRLSQYTEEIEYSGETKTMYFPTLKGGMLYRHNNYATYFDTPFAFYVKYIGESDTASIQNNGTELILKSGADIFTYTLSSYDSVYDLYAALKTNSLFDVKYKELEGHTCDELAIFPECTLISNYYTETNTEQSPRVEYENSCAPFFVPYAKDDKWHQVEIVKIDDYIYTSVDGQYYDRNTYIGRKVLQLGGNCGVYFKDLEIGLNTVFDAEIVDNVIVSSASPCLIVFEGHGMLDKPIDEFSGSKYSEEGMATSTDRLYYVFREMIKKGYVPVTIDDVNAYYNRERYIPKRSFTIVFDDFRYENCLDLAFRKVFIELGVKPALAIIYNASREIVFDGNVITKKEASEICLRNNFQLLNHTNHGNAKDINPSLLMSKYENDVIQADKILVDGMTIVYPFGAANLYIYNTLKWLGCKLGINVEGNPHHNPLYSNRYNIRRVEIGSRDTLENIINNIY